MNEQFDQLVGYIAQQLNQGVPEDNIRGILSQQSWDAELVNRAFETVKAPTPPTLEPAPLASAAPASAPLASAPLDPASPDPASPAPILNAATAAPNKYKVFRALGDTFQAIRNNAGTFLLSVIASYVVAGVSFFAISLLTSRVLYSGFLFASISRLLMILFGSLILYTLWYAFAVAFILAATSLALQAGSERRKSSIGATISNSFARVGRVALANTLFALVSFWPVALIVFLPYIFILSGHSDGNIIVLLLPVTMVVGIIWVYIALVRFALAPYVALFEPDISVLKSLGRSKHLLTKGGQWFIVKGFVLLLLFVSAIAVATHQSLTQLMNSNNVATSIVLTLVTIIVNGALVMLYLNRKMVRG